MAKLERSNSGISLVSQMSQVIVGMPKQDWQEMKSYAKPPEGVKDVMAACLVLLGYVEKVRQLQ